MVRPVANVRIECADWHVLMRPARPASEPSASTLSCIPAPFWAVSPVACRPVDSVELSAGEPEAHRPIKFGVFLERLNRAYALEKPRFILRQTTGYPAAEVHDRKRRIDLLA